MFSRISWSQKKDGLNSIPMYYISPNSCPALLNERKPSSQNLSGPVTLTKDQIVNAVALILIGMVRKIIFADALNALIPADAFVHPLNYSATILFTWLLAYAFAIYNDFAGYSSMVRGVSSLFGIELANNFNIPYLSRNFSEFWKSLAYQPFELVARLHIFSNFPSFTCKVGQPVSHIQPHCSSNSHHACQRSLARGFLEFTPMGSNARNISFA